MVLNLGLTSERYKVWEHFSSDYFLNADNPILREMGQVTEWGDFELSERGLDSFNKLFHPELNPHGLMKALNALYEKELLNDR